MGIECMPIVIMDLGGGGRWCPVLLPLQFSAMLYTHCHDNHCFNTEVSFTVFYNLLACLHDV